MIKEWAEVIFSWRMRSKRGSKYATLGNVSICLDVASCKALMQCLDIECRHTSTQSTPSISIINFQTFQVDTTCDGFGFLDIWSFYVFLYHLFGKLPSDSFAGARSRSSDKTLATKDSIKCLPALGTRCSVKTKTKHTINIRMQAKSPIAMPLHRGWCCVMHAQKRMHA